MKNRLIFFVTDRGYLLPSVVAALQAAGQPKVAALADIVIFLFDMSVNEVSALNEAFAGSGVEFRYLDNEKLEAIADENIGKSHLSKASLGRLIVSEAMPEQYENLIYLDGDIQIVGDIAPLIGFDVAPGKILAAPDSTMIVSRDGSAFASENDQYTGALGLKARQDYFNCGVLAVRRDTWAELSLEALGFYTNNGALCRYYDQSALNAVALSRRQKLHPNFNFMPPYRRVGTRKLKPAIIHFIGPNKPWHPEETSWLRDYYPIYTETVAAFPVLKPYPAPKQTAAARQKPPKSKWGLLAWFQQLTQRQRLDAYLHNTRFDLIAS